MRYAVLDRLYEQALEGLPVLGTPRDAAERFAPGTSTERADRLRALYVALCGGTGFAFGVTGLLTAPVTMPANIASVAVLQLHLCAAMAATAGYDPTDAAVREVCIECVMRSSEADDPEERETQSLLARLGTKAAERGLRVALEQGARLVSRGARSLPLLGGLIGGASDAYATGDVARAAEKAFLGAGNPRDALDGLIA